MNVKTGCSLLAVMVVMAGTDAVRGDDGGRFADACAGCHGTDGLSPGETIPSISGLRRNYFLAAMRDYQSDARNHEEMARIARGYDDHDLALLADWFAAMPWVATSTAVDADLAREGSRKARVQCGSCHGPTGEGGISAPRLAGQPAGYLMVASAAYRDKLRTGAGARAKAWVMEDLGDDEIEMLAHYYAGLR